MLILIIRLQQILIRISRWGLKWHRWNLNLMRHVASVLKTCTAIIIYHSVSLVVVVTCIRNVWKSGLYTSNRMHKRFRVLFAELTGAKMLYKSWRLKQKNIRKIKDKSVQKRRRKFKYQEELDKMQLYRWFNNQVIDRSNVDAVKEQFFTKQNVNV